MYDRPTIVKGSTSYAVLYWSDVCFTVLFGIEMLIKMTAFTAKEYIRHTPSAVDTGIVATSVLTLALESYLHQISVIKGLRVLRAVKPLRAITRSAGMQLVLRSILLVSRAAVPVMPRPTVGAPVPRRLCMGPAYDNCPLVEPPAVYGGHGQRVSDPAVVLHHLWHPGRPTLRRKVLLLQRPDRRRQDAVRGHVCRP